MHSAEQPEAEQPQAEEQPEQSVDEKSPEKSSDEKGKELSEQESSEQIDPKAELREGRSLATVLFFLSIGLFAISLISKVIQFGVHTESSNQYFDPNMPTYGLIVVLMGWSRFIFAISPADLDPFGTLMHVIGLLGWFANPALIIATFSFYVSRRMSVTSSIVAVCLSMISLAIIGEHDPFHVLVDEAPANEAFRLMDGYMYWAGSIISMATANAIMLSYENRYRQRISDAQKDSAVQLFEAVASSLPPETPTDKQES